MQAEAAEIKAKADHLVQKGGVEPRAATTLAQEIVYYEKNIRANRASPAAIATARELTGKGVDKPIAEAMAETFVARADDTLATKADLARLDGKIDRLEGQMKFLILLVVGLYVAMGTGFFN